MTSIEERDKNPQKNEGAFLPCVLLKRKDISIQAKVVYAKLTQFLDEETLLACPLAKTLAASLSTSEKSVRRRLSELKKAGAIDWKQRGLGQSNVYWFLPLAEYKVGD